jgi:ERCC4-type nuclease
MAKEIWSYLNTLQILAGVYVWQSGTARSTAQWLVNLYHWWSSKPVDAHKSHVAPHVKCAQLNTKKPPLVQRVAAELSGVGFGRSKAVAKRFGGLMEMVLASEEDWKGIEGIGKVLAKRIIKEVHGDEQ